MADGERYWSIVKPIWDKVSIYDDPDVFLSQFLTLPAIAGHLFAAHWCQSEVRNGGLHQFFSNSTGVLAPEALAGFRAIGLSEWADVLDKAMQFFGEAYPRTRAERTAFLASHPSEGEDDPFAVLEDLFFAWLKSEPRGRWERAADHFAVEHGI